MFFQELSLTDIYMYLVKGFTDIICFLNVLLLYIFNYKVIRFLKGKRHVYPNVHRSTVYNSQDMEAT